MNVRGLQRCGLVLPRPGAEIKAVYDEVCDPEVGVGRMRWVLTFAQRCWMDTRTGNPVHALSQHHPARCPRAMQARRSMAAPATTPPLLRTHHHREDPHTLMRIQGDAKLHV